MKLKSPQVSKLGHVWCVFRRVNVYIYLFFIFLSVGNGWRCSLITRKDGKGWNVSSDEARGKEKNVNVHDHCIHSDLTNGLPTTTIVSSLPTLGSELDITGEIVNRTSLTSSPYHASPRNKPTSHEGYQLQVISPRTPSMRANSKIRDLVCPIYMVAQKAFARLQEVFIGLSR